MTLYSNFMSAFFFIISALLFYLFFLRSDCKSRTPSPDSYPIIGNLVAFLRNRHRFLEWITDLLSQTPTQTLKARLFLLANVVNTANPINLQHLLTTNFSNYIKGHRFHPFFADLLGHGIFNVDGHLWLLQRKIASHEFNTKSLRTFVIDIVQSEISNRLMPLLSNSIETGETIDLQSVFQHFAFDNICNLAFGDDPACLGSSADSPFLRAFDEAVEICSSRLLEPVPFLWKVKRYLNVGSEKRLRGAVRVLDDYAMKIIKSRNQELQSNNGVLLKQDLLSRFMAVSSNSTMEELGFLEQRDREKFLRDIVVSFILAGKDTTSSALSWFFWLLSTNPHCEHKVYEEIQRFAARKPGDLGCAVFGYDELKKMHYLHAAVSESLRLFPPVPINSKLTVTDDVLPDGTFVGGGWFADYSAFAMGRMEEIWGSDCRNFSPERWLENGVFVPVNQFKFPVFHAGPRVCLGKDMAYIQMKSVVASILHSFEVQAVNAGSQPPAYCLSLTLKMKGGLPVRLRRRVSA